MPYEARLALFIVVASLLGILFFLWFFYKPIKRKIYSKRPNRLFYKKIRQIVLDHDYYLINEMGIKEGDYEVKIDHLIGGDKFLYLIFDLYCEGGISLNPDDKKWIVYDKNGKHYIDSPLDAAESILAKLSARSGIEAGYMVAIVVVNDDCFLSPYHNRGNSPLLVPLSRLAETIAKSESADVADLRSEELYNTIRNLYAYYKREKDA